MFAVEFRTKIKDGMIELPKRFKGAISDTVKVILLKEDVVNTSSEGTDRPDMIAQLLASPLEIPGFRPFTRDEIHVR